MVIKFKNKKEVDQEVKNLELSEEQLECNISILRNLDDGQNETKIGHAIMTTSNGSVELSQLELRTGTKDYLNTLSDEAELYLSKDGKIVGRVLLPTAFGNNRLDMLNFGSNFIPMIGGNGPEGRHSYQVEPGLDISIFVEWCFDN